MDTFGNAQAIVIPLDLSENQFQIYNKISRNYSHSFLFESLSGPEVLAETSVMGFDPKIIFKGYSDKVEITENNTTTTIQTTEPFVELKKLLGKSNDQKYRYLGGAVGVVNYDSIRLVENISKENNLSQPIMEFGIYDDGLLYDNVEKKLFYFYHDVNRFDQLLVSKDSFDKFYSSEVIPNMNKEKFSGIVNKAKQYIHDGDIFQVVLSRKFEFETSGDNLTLYKTLRKLNPSPYMYHLKQDSKTIIGASPEMLVRITDDKVETFPIAGTREITENEEKNQALSEELINDEKELAEHTMLVDLGRNDIGRVCKYGTVHPESLMQIKRFSHVQHIVSHIVGTLDSKNDMFNAFQAVFPAGTVSGAPKVRAMQIIDELETEKRGPYAGAVGYFSYNGCCDFAIAIRSIFIENNKGFVQSGAGIVSDSVAENEFNETEHKASAMLQALKEASN
ncbi:MAG: anthranilate synthase component I family protein [Candidatus Nitrosopumilus limneticus]|nr:Anthranilate synthase component 1 [Candidatus Nitrosopumilus limneticus]MDC4212779.1 anthranilate synthase component I family protein [Candidatus Nitrosopumilus limneticus]MDC4213300.1 anthranilate synthase component I family protein [Candidatus Nitrosopumilus limneticus]MDC4215606.1 anthranilate synthase component I family protein [Candidatus Nitrosopumilus limneticus]MDC4216797.1 anthranilate synthase component I family protein [Candidatus Nitrosopumilus limneticus]